MQEKIIVKSIKNGKLLKTDVFSDYEDALAHAYFRRDFYGETIILLRYDDKGLFQKIKMFPRS